MPRARGAVAGRKCDTGDTLPEFLGQRASLPGIESPFEKPNERPRAKDFSSYGQESWDSNHWKKYWSLRDSSKNWSHEKRLWRFQEECKIAFLEGTDTIIQL